MEQWFIAPYTDTDSGRISQELAYAILEKLAALGLKNRGILVDEGLGMILYPKQNGVPGILIEHAFMNNASDVLNYLSSDDKLKKLGVADATAIAEYCKLEKKGSGKYKTYKKNAGKISTEINEAGTEYTMSTSKVAKAYSLKYKVWNETQGSASAKWYKAVINSKGVWEASFSISDFKKKGTYQIQAYVINEDKSKTRVAKTAVTVTGPAAEKIKVQSIKPQKGTFKVKISGLTSESAIKKVTVKVWSQADKKDLYTYTAKLQKDGSYLATVNIKRHNYNYGKYQFHVYAKDENGITTRFKKQKTTLERPSLKATVKGKKNQTKYTISIEKNLGIQAVKMAVWSEKDGQNDLRWYRAKAKADGGWSTDVTISKHKTAGNYSVDVYGTNMVGQEVYLGNTSFTVKEPTIKKIVVRKLKPQAGTFYVYAEGVTAKAGVQAVTVRVWTKKDKSDIYTYTAKAISEGTYRIKVNIKNHNNNYGTYKLKVYVKDKRGIKINKTIKQKFVLPPESDTKPEIETDTEDVTKPEIDNDVTQ